MESGAPVLSGWVFVVSGPPSLVKLSIIPAISGTRPRRGCSTCRLIPIRVTRVIPETSSPIITMVIRGISFLPLTPIHDPLKSDLSYKAETPYRNPGRFGFLSENSPSVWRTPILQKWADAHTYRTAHRFYQLHSSDIPH